MSATRTAARFAVTLGFLTVTATMCPTLAATTLEIQKGQYLVRAGDCASCHTAEGGKPYAGGRPIQTPFGVIYSTNLTPDANTGIGRWSSDDFYRAMHDGVH